MTDRAFYVCCGEGRYRSWDDWVRYGFVSGGQGRWYSRTLGLLRPGATVFAYIPKTGYVGAGTVTEPAVPVTDFAVRVDGRTLPLLDAPGLEAPHMHRNAGDPERSEYAVRVRWERTLAREDAAIWPLREPEHGLPPARRGHPRASGAGLRAADGLRARRRVTAPGESPSRAGARQSAARTVRARGVERVISAPPRDGALQSGD